MPRILLTFTIFTSGLFLSPLFAQDFYGLKVNKAQKLDYMQDSIHWMLEENIPDPFDQISYDPTIKSLKYYVEKSSPSDIELLRNVLSGKFEYSGRTPEECECPAASPGRGGDPDDACWCVKTFVYNYLGKKVKSASLIHSTRTGEVTIVFVNE